MTTKQIELAIAIAYYNQKVRELELAEKELKRLIDGACRENSKFYEVSKAKQEQTDWVIKSGGTGVDENGP